MADLPKNPHAVLGSELAMNAACNALSGSIHIGSVNSNLGPQGKAFAKEVEKHVQRINAALANWREALAYYEEMHK